MYLRGRIKKTVLRILPVIIVLLYCNVTIAVNPPSKGKAIIADSDNKPSIPISKDLHAYIDSILDLKHVSSEALSAISFYKSILDKDEKELEYISDSLFHLDQIPYSFLNEVNYQLGKESSYRASNNPFNIPYDDSPYPANYFYQTWNTSKANPYSLALSKNDTTITLELMSAVNFCEYQFPLEGKTVVTSKFGWRNGRNHNGYDLDLEVWDPVKSSFSGVVRVAKTMGHFGRLVIVRHYNGLETYYAHLHKLKVKEGDIVEAGDIIGLGGSSGRSTGSHLHYEIRFKGIPLDPGKIIAFKEQQLVSNTIVLNRTKWSYGILPKDVTFHQVKKGDYLYKIAESYGQTIDGICALNGIKRNTVLQVGQKLQIAKP